MTTEFKVVIGLETHVQLKTHSKLFCRCSTQFGCEPNTQTCPVCLGLPGSLPVLNSAAVDLSIRAGLGLHSQISRFTKWDRKNYFYPDLPKGYQISQFDLPICVGGHVELARDLSAAAQEPRRIRLVRAHLEEDAGKSMHDEVQGKADSRIDLNRTGTPLLEIVSEPDIRSAEEAKAYLIELRRMLLALDVSDCNMQEGSLRADANVNLHILDSTGEWIATPIVEIKNLNSFRAVERAIEYEANRQLQLWKNNGKKIGEAPKQTRGWDDQAGVTTLQREKEESDEYRYFPDPDLVPVVKTAQEVDAIRTTIGELPLEKIHRYQSELGLSYYDSDVIVSQGDRLTDYFESIVANAVTAKRASSWVQQDVLRCLKDSNSTLDDFPISAGKLSELLLQVDQGKLETARAREVFQNLLKSPALAVQSAIDALGIVAVDANELEDLCRRLLEANPDVVAKFRDGNVKALGALVGQAKKQNPNAEPRIIQEICQRLLEQNG